MSGGTTFTTGSRSVALFQADVLVAALVCFVRFTKDLDLPLRCFRIGLAGTGCKDPAVALTSFRGYPQMAFASGHQLCMGVLKLIYKADICVYYFICLGFDLASPVHQLRTGFYWMAISVS
jgi:hypothetical protein